MDRNIFLQMCQRVSMLKNGICGIKENVTDDLKVIHNGMVYYPIAYELSFNQGEATHIAKLHELNANSVKHAKLERIEKYES